MRWLSGFLLVVLLCLVGGYIFVKGYPYRLYSKWSQGEGWDKNYIINSYRDIYLKPIPIDPIESIGEDYKQLWKPFPLRNTMVPLPVRHPLYRTLPIIQRYNSKLPPLVGISIHSGQGRELSNIYTVEGKLLPDFSLGQELFKLPFVRNRILKYDISQTWKDVYSKEIEVKSKTMDEMIYDLYIIHLRSEMIPQKAIKYGLIQNDVGVLEIASDDKDYKVEVINKLLNGQIYTYILKTDLRNIESTVLRSRFLSSINFNHVDNSMGNIVYREFKELDFKRKVDQEGMLYLFSAWSLDIENSELMREMIWYLERGTHNDLHLVPLQHYSFAKFGSTFTTKASDGSVTDPNIHLQKMIELERRAQRDSAARESNSDYKDAMDGLSESERLKLKLQRAKESDPLKSKEVIVY